MMKFWQHRPPAYIHAKIFRPSVDPARGVNYRDNRPLITYRKEQIG